MKIVIYKIFSSKNYFIFIISSRKIIKKMSIEDEAQFVKKMDGAKEEEHAEPLPLKSYY